MKNIIEAIANQICAYKKKYPAEIVAKKLRKCWKYV